MSMYLPSQDNDAPFDTLSLVDVQTVSAGDTTRAGFYSGLVKDFRPSYASRTLMPRRFANKNQSQCHVILPAGQLASGTLYHCVQRTTEKLSPAPGVVKARAYYSPRTAPQTPLLGASAQPRLPFTSHAASVVMLEVLHD